MINNSNFIKDVETQETGGGMSLDFVYLKNGHILGISEDCVVLYDNISSIMEKILL